VRGTVNGVFDEEPASLFLKLTEAYGLLSYFDGRAMHVTTTSDVRSRVIPFAPMTPGAVASLLRSLDLDAPAFPIRYANTSIKVSGPSRYVAAVADAVDKAQRQTVPDVPFDETSIRVFPLRYAQAQDLTYTVNGRDQIVPGVATLLRNLMRSTFAPRAPAADKRNARSGVPPLPGLRGTGMADISLPQTEGAMSESVRNATQDDVTPSRQNIAADARTNSVVIYDVPAMMPHYQRAIAMLDQPQELIEIDAAVIDLTSGLTSQLGVQWGGANGRVNLGVGTAAADSTFRRPDLPGVGSLTSGLNFATLIGNSTQYLFSQIQALEENGKARIVSRPQVLTLNNSEAVLSSRSSVYVRVAGNQDVDLYNVDTGLSLKVTPMVESGAARDAARDTDLDAQKNIRLNIQIDDGAFNTSLTVDGIPNVNNHSIVTQAVVRNGESLLIGGYQYDRNETTVSKVPMLGDVPYLGTLFRNKKATHERLERLILITPHIRRRAGRGDAPSGSGPGSVRAAVAPTQPTPTAVVPNANVAPSAADPRRAVAIYPAPPVDPLRTPSSARDVPPLVQTLEQKR
jgi:type III secretion protein C